MSYGYVDLRCTPQQSRAGSLSDGVGDLHPQFHAGREEGQGKEPKQTQGEANVHRLVVKGGHLTSVGGGVWCRQGREGGREGGRERERELGEGGHFFPS